MTSPATTLVLRGARVIDPASGIDAVQDLWIQDGRIAESDVAGRSGPVTELCFPGAWILPALTDLHTIVRDPGYEYKETLEQLADSAVAGGYTRLVTSPETAPVCDSAPVAQQLVDRACRYGKVSIHPLGAILRGLQSESLADLFDLAQMGVAGFSDGGHPLNRPDVLRHALEYLRRFDLPLFLRCEDPALAAGRVMHEGFTSTLLGLKGIPGAAEEIMIYQALALGRLTGGRLHLTQLSTGRSVELVARARAEGVRVTCDVSPHHLWYTDDRVKGYEPSARVSPPLRSASDRETLLQGLNDGTIDAIASGHSPQSLLEKEVEFEAAQPGVTSLETTLSAVLTLVSQGLVDRDRAIDAVCYRPAAIGGLVPAALHAGASAELVVVYPEERFQVDAAALQSPCRSSLFAGVSLLGRVAATIHQGRIVFQRVA